MSLSDSIVGVEYRLIQSFPGYCIGSDGTVWSQWRNNGKTDGPWKKLKQFATQYGYMFVRLYRNRYSYNKLVHHLVLEAFVGERPSRMICCHGNGDPSDNRIENLRWDTQSENYQDAVRHGTAARGEKQGHAKVTECEVMEIRRLCSMGIKQKEIGRRFGIKQVTVSAILHRRNWKHV